MNSPTAMHQHKTLAYSKNNELTVTTVLYVFATYLSHCNHISAKLSPVCPAKWNAIFMNFYIVHFIFMANKFDIWFDLINKIEVKL